MAGPFGNPAGLASASRCARGSPVGFASPTFARVCPCRVPSDGARGTDRAVQLRPTCRGRAWDVVVTVLASQVQGVKDLTAKKNCTDGRRRRTVATTNTLVGGGSGYPPGRRAVQSPRLTSGGTRHWNGDAPGERLQPGSLNDATRRARTVQLKASFFGTRRISRGRRPVTGPDAQADLGLPEKAPRRTSRNQPGTAAPRRREGRAEFRAVSAQLQQRRCSNDGSGERTRYARGVLRFSVPVLPSRGADAEAGGEQVRRQGAHRLSAVPPIASLHPFALKAAEASLCANEQGKFWPLHDRMFDDQTKLGVSDLKQQARELGMDGKKFDACLDAGKYVEQVQNDMKEGQRSRVAGLRQYSSTAVWWRRFSAVPRTRGADRQGVGARKADVLTRCTNGAG